MKYKKGTFVVIPNLERLDILTSTSQALFIWLCKYSNEDGECFPSRNKLAQHLHCDVRTIDKHIDFLIQLGFITKEVRKKKGTKENMSNLYQIQLVRHPSEVIATTPSEVNVPVTIPNINYTNLTNISKTETSPFSFIESFEKLGNSKWKPDLIIYNYWSKKGFTFENEKQFKSARSRSLRSAQALEGYTSKQINDTMEYCEQNYKEFGWTLETVLKRIPLIANIK